MTETFRETFKRIFGFDKPDEEDPHIPNDGETYGLAAYGAFGSRSLQEPYWEYSMGNFDYIWGRYVSFRRFGVIAIAMYIIDDNGLTERPTQIIDAIDFVGDRSLRYGISDLMGNGIQETRKYVTLYSALEKIPPVEFRKP
jgi:hypothetical protein